MNIPFKRILIISDIEGSSGCFGYRTSSFMTKDWRYACVGMTKDVNHVVTGLFDAGVEEITIKDFHRTGYNIIPELIEPPAKVISGYKLGPVPGIKDSINAEAIRFLGMHAASGTKGFLAHTLTSRLARLEVNGKPMSEVELFSASLASYGMRPIFFSGCPVACRQAQAAVKKIHVYPIDKNAGPQNFDADLWRFGLKKAAVQSLNNISTEPYTPKGPFKAVATMRDGEQTARKIALRWDFRRQDARIFIDAPDIHSLYNDLIRLCYLTPLIEKMIPFWLFVYDLWGRFGLAWVRRGLKPPLKHKD